MMSAENPTPWRTQPFLSGTAIMDAAGAVVWPTREFYEGVILRANATAGLTDEALEKGIIAWLMEQARGREWLPLRGTEGYCPECAHTPNEGHAPFCERGGFYAALGTAETEAAAE